MNVFGVWGAIARVARAGLRHGEVIDDSRPVYGPVDAPQHAERFFGVVRGGGGMKEGKIIIHPLFCLVFRHGGHTIGYERDDPRWQIGGRAWDSGVAYVCVLLHVTAAATWWQFRRFS